MKNAILTFLCLLGPVAPMVAQADQYPLHSAVQQGKPSRVRALLSYDRINSRNGSDLTPLMMAAMYDRSTSASILIEAGASVNEATYSYSTTALMMAAMNGYHEVVEVLLRGGAEIDARNKSGFTALMLAAQKGHAHVVRQLLQAGADAHLLDASNRSALTHAATDEVRYILQSVPPAHGDVSLHLDAEPSPELQMPISDKPQKFPLEF